MVERYRISGHHINRLVRYYESFDDFESFRRDMSLEGLYDELSVEKITAFHRLLLEQPNAEIELVEGADDICRLCCNQCKCFNPQLEGVAERADRDYLRKYGLESGEVHTLRDILLNLVFWKTEIPHSIERN